MKLDALDHPKTLDFAARLDISLPLAIGHLELLWAFTATKTPHGNIGKWADGAIARGAHWQGDPQVFVQALIDAGFLDHSENHRLLVHDWSHHSPNWVKAKLRKLDEPFASDDSTDVRAGVSAGARADDSTDDSAFSPRARSPRHATPRHESITSPDGEASSASADNPSKQGNGKAPPCPHDKIIAAYHEELPELRPVQVWNDQRRKLLQTRWRESPKRQDVEYWRRYFRFVRESEFLMGRAEPGPGKKPFSADLEWLVRPSNFAKVVEGKYHG